MDGSLNKTQEAPASNKTIFFKLKLFFSLIILLGGIIFMTLSILDIYTYYQKSKSFVEINGIVSYYNYDEERLKAIVVKYTINGETYELVSKEYTHEPESVGDTVPIKYNKDDPSDVIWKYDSINIIYPIVSGIIAIIGFIMMTATIKSKLRKKKTTDVNNESKEEVKKEEVNPTKHVVAPDQQTLGQLRAPSVQNSKIEDNNVNVD